MHHTSAIPVLALILAAPVIAQEFDAASVRLNKSGAYESAIRREGGQVIFDNVPLREIVCWAYGISADREYGLSGPGWLAADHYDIAASVSPAVPREQILKMMQRLLRDRFGMAVRRENKEARVYALSVVRGGPKLRPPSRTDGNFTYRPGHILAEGLSMAALADRLSGPVFKLGVPVLNRTGLAGAFDFTIDWTPDETLAERGPGPSLFTALQEQLGLKLQASKAQVEVLIIDRIERTAKPN